jgi:hypothetical protein
MTIKPIPSDSIGLFSNILFAASMIIKKAAMKIRIASTTPDTFSNLPCPYGWVSSAGVSDILTEKNEIIEASRSIDECMASDKILTEPDIKPTINFMIIRKVLENIESLATLIFLLISIGFELLQK